MREAIMRTFTATTDGPNRLALRELLQQYANDQWVAAHMAAEQAAATVLDCFKRLVVAELQLLDLECVDQPE
jgi:hypothetical protein